MDKVWAGPDKNGDLYSEDFMKKHGGEVNNFDRHFYSYTQSC